MTRPSFCNNAMAAWQQAVSLLQRHRGWCLVWLCLILGLIGLGSRLELPKTIERLELALLDFRLQARAEHLTPSSDIIVAAMDRRTQDEIRNHPELGLVSRVLPRRHVAQMIDFFASRGAKSIVMDLSFEEPQSPEDDRLLAEAIHRAGNVYLAASMELPLSEYKTRQQSKPEDVRTDVSIAFANERLFPYIEQKTKRPHWLPSLSCETGYWLSGIAPLFRINQALTLPDGIFEQRWQQSCYPQSLYEATQHASASPYVSSVSSLTQADPPKRATDPLDALYRQQCLEQMYQQIFANNPGYLALLNTMQTPVSMRPPSSHPQNIQAYCLTSAIVENVLKNSRGLGITSVDYDPDAIVREIPLFYQGYQGNLYAYLGLRPVLDWMAPTRPQLETQWLSFPKLSNAKQDVAELSNKQIPVLANGQVIINWRSPKPLVKQMEQSANTPAAGSASSLATSQASNEVISAEKGNRALGYGHLYRMVSAIDVLRQSETKTRGIETPSLYNRYAEPASGLLSFRNKIVVYGDAIEDVHRTPVGNRIYGPEIVATTLDMFLHDRQFVQKAPLWSVCLMMLAIATLIFYSQIATSRLTIGFLAGLAFIVLYWVYNILTFIQTAYWLPLVTPSLFFTLTLIGGLLYRYSIHDREKRQLTRIFSRYVSPQVMNEIISHPESSLETLAGAEKNLTVLFADLKGFTERFTKEDPQRMVQQLNEFFTVMTRIILKHQGTYDKYIGDCIMAFFGAPVEFPNHAEKACAAALEMQATLQEMNERWRAAGIPELHMGIGLSSGDMIVGNFGSDDLQNFTVMGNAVNLGSRLESLTRKVNAPIVISDETAQQAGSRIITKNLGLHSLKGFQEPLQAYSLEGYFETAENAS